MENFWDEEFETQKSDPAQAFSILASDARIAILEAFWSEYPTPISYSDIQDRSGIEDNGKLNYHLDKLNEQFVTKVPRGYQLLPAGRQALITIHSGVVNEHIHTDKIEIDATCPDCGGTPLAWYRDNEIMVQCRECDRRITRMSFPPSRVQNNDLRTALAGYSVRKLTWNTLAYRGVCIYCHDVARNYIDVDDEFTALDYPAVMECRGCDGTFHTHLAERLLPHPTVVSFFYDHGIDIYDRPYWETPETVHETAEAVSEVPLRVEVRYTVDSTTLRLIVTRDLDLLQREELTRLDNPG